jgi:hypothetical protein
MGVYIVKSDGTTAPLLEVSTKNEDKELQRILELNLDLLPGEQIEPEDPRRWFLVKREMPILEWSIDFLFLDQNAVPTFVECKRYADTRARREVVGQVFEYVANAQREWTAVKLREVAEATAKQTGKTVEQYLHSLPAADFKDSESFFAKAEENLKNTIVRVVFFLEQAPQELKRLVEFLNSEMKNCDVLLVEARQYEKDGFRVVVPRLFGFTEQIRRTKELSNASTSRKPIATDWDSFVENARSKGMSESSIAKVRIVFETCEQLSAEIVWGRGVATGSFSPKWSALSPTGSVFSIYANGNLEMHFSSFKVSEAAQRVVDSLANEMNRIGFTLPANYLTSWYTYEPSDWMPLVDGFVTAIRRTLSDALATAAAT